MYWMHPLFNINGSASTFHLALKLPFPKNSLPAWHKEATPGSSRRRNICSDRDTAFTHLQTVSMGLAEVGPNILGNFSS